MTDLRAAVSTYLALRRSLGYALTDAGRLLPDFVGYLEHRTAAHLTTELALAWATQPTNVQPTWWRQRLGAVRGFAEYPQNIDPDTEVPPRDLLPATYNRITPYLYSDADITGLMTAARSLAPPLRAATYETLIGLLSVSGLRIGEAIALNRDDVDDDALLLTVRHAKRGGRQVPLDETTIQALREYAQLRDRHFPTPHSRSFLVSIRGTRLCQGAVHDTFPSLLRRAGLSGRGQRCRPRIHDLRHSFAVHQLLDWHQQGVDVDARMPLLSSVLGHISPASTYWYLHAAPELFATVSKRLDEVLGELP
jgi:integrase/recombinase XerD